MAVAAKLTGLLFAILLLLGCTSHPLGIADKEWQQLTPEQQLQARIKQSELDEAARLRRQQQQAARAAEELHLVELRSNAPYGDVVQCTFRQTQARYANGEWHPAQPTSFAIHRTEDDRRINLPRQSRPSMSTDVHVGFDGLNVKVCKWYDRDCATLAGTERTFRRGYTQAIEVKGLVQGQLFCSYPVKYMRF